MTIATGVIGGGAFGRGLAAAVAGNGQPVVLWTRKERDLGLEGVRTTSELADLKSCDLLLVAAPSHAMVKLGEQLAAIVDGSHLLVHVSRGLVGEYVKPVTEVFRELTPCRRLGALAGPLTADALIEAKPAGAIIGTHFPEVTHAVRETLSSPTLRIYDTSDVIGVQIATATAGMLALMLGYAERSGVEPAALAVLATRGMVEASRIGATFGAKPTTFNGLAGFGDLLAAVAGDGRPEYELGRVLADGVELQQAIQNVSSYIEGVQVAERLIVHAERHAIDAPITQALVAVLSGRLTAKDAVADLMQRPESKE